MANLFERPMAANPLSEFVALPLEFMQHTVDKREAMYNQVKAELEQAKDGLLGTRSAIGDRARHQQLLSEIESKFDSIADEAGGDYSLVGPKLDMYKRKLKHELSYGELGAMNNAFNDMVAARKNLDELYQSNKIRPGGYAKGLEAISKYKTHLKEDNTWSTFTPYQPSMMGDVRKELVETLKNTHDQYDETGHAYKSDKELYTAIQGYMRTNPEAYKSLQEDFDLQYKGSKDKYQQAFQSHVRDVMEEAAASQRFYQFDKLTEKQLDKKASKEEADNFRFTSNNWQLGGLSGAHGYTGGSASFVKDLAKKYLNLHTTEEHDSWVKSAEGKDVIKNLESTTGTKFPSTYREQSKWILDGLNKPKVANLDFKGVSDDVAKHYITEKGFLTNPAIAIRDKNGNLIDNDERAELQGNTKEGRVARVQGQLVKGVGNLPYGSIHLLGANGKEYIMEPSDPTTFASSEFNLDLIDSAVRTNSGKDKVTLKGAIREGGTGAIMIPAGTYDVSKDNYNRVILSVNGQKKFVKTEELDRTGKTHPVFHKL